jgi:hypothetical protein
MKNFTKEHVAEVVEALKTKNVVKVNGMIFVRTEKSEDPFNQATREMTGKAGGFCNSGADWDWLRNVALSYPDSVAKDIIELSDPTWSHTEFALLRNGVFSEENLKTAPFCVAHLMAQQELNKLYDFGGYGVDRQASDMFPIDKFAVELLGENESAIDLFVRARNVFDQQLVENKDKPNFESELKPEFMRVINDIYARISNIS